MIWPFIIGFVCGAVLVICIHKLIKRREERMVIAMIKSIEEEMEKTGRNKKDD